MLATNRFTCGFFHDECYCQASKRQYVATFYVILVEMGFSSCHEQGNLKTLTGQKWWTSACFNELADHGRFKTSKTVKFLLLYERAKGHFSHDGKNKC